MMKIPTFADFSEKIRGLSLQGPTSHELEQFLIEDDGSTRLYYAPFDWVNTAARVAIVGITPGRDSMINAFRAAASALRNGETLQVASRRARQTGSFSNMRLNLSRMLDEIGIPAALGISGSADLFGSRYDLLHPTACVRHPVFVLANGKCENYSGHKPKLLEYQTGLYYIENLLADELRRIPEALIVPNGKAVDGALRHLASLGLIEPRRCVFGFPHASGANGHRNEQLREQLPQLRGAVADWAASQSAL